MVVRVVGVPWDATSIGRKGARMGPAAIRSELDERLHPFDETARRPVSWEDGGDLVVGDDHDTMVVAIQEAQSSHLQQDPDSPLVLLGGDHAVAYGGVAAVRQGFPDLHVVSVDAHLDLRPTTDGPTNGNWAHRVLRDFRRPLWEVGTGRFSNEESLFDVARQLGVRLTSAGEIRRLGVARALAELGIAALRDKDIYLSIDLDVVDQAYAPGTSAPAVGGLTPNAVVEIIELVSRTGRIRGFDLVEVNPEVDPAGLTPRLAAYLLLVFLSSFNHRSEVRGDLPLPQY